MKSRTKSSASLFFLFLLSAFLPAAPIDLPVVSPQPAFASFPADSFETDFFILGPFPRRCYPGITYRHRFGAFEWRHRQLTWTGTNMPAGMTIDSATGDVAYTCPSAGTTDANIQIKASRAACDSSVFLSCVLDATVTFDLASSTTDFIFVSTTGSDGSGTGTIAAPYRTANKARQVLTGSNGKTIFLRSGTYAEDFGSNTWYAGQTFSEADAAGMECYNGETCLIDVSGSSGSRGVHYDGTASWIFHKVPVKGNKWGSSGAIFLSCSNCIAQDTEGYGDRSTDNNAGCGIAGKHAILYRMVCHDSAGAIGAPWNVRAVIAYADAEDAGGWNYVIDSKAYDATVCFGQKHDNDSTAHTIFHGNEAVSCQYGFGGHIRKGAVQFNVMINSSGFGIYDGIIDPAAGNGHDGTWYDHNTIIGSLNDQAGIGIQPSYCDTGACYFYRGIYYQGNGAASGGRCDATSARKMFCGWVDTALATATNQPIVSDYNVWWNTNAAGSTSAFEIDGGSGLYSLTTWKALGGTGSPLTRDTHSVHSDPLFQDVSTYNLNVTTSSPAWTACGGSGEYCGAFLPGRSTPFNAVGVKNTTLINWDVAQAGGTTGGSSTGSGSTGTTGGSTTGGGGTSGDAGGGTFFHGKAPIRKGK